MRKNRPHIAVVSPFLDKRHGTERCVVEQLEALADEFEFHVYSMRVEDIDLRKIVWHRVPSIPGPHLAKYIWFFTANHLWRWFGRISQRTEFDLTYSPGINCFDAELIAVHIVFAEFFARLYSGSGIRSLPQPSRIRRIHRKLFYRLIIWLERRIYSRKALPLIAVSKKVRQDLERFYGGPRQAAFVNYNGIQPAKFNPEVRKDIRSQARNALGNTECDFVLLLIGNDLKKKGLSCLLEAVALLKQSWLKVYVVSEDDISPFRGALAASPLKSSLRSLPLRHDPEFYYAVADAYVAPSLEDAFGIPTLEAMACGLPVIVSRQSGVSEIVTHGVDGMILEDATDADTFAVTIQQIYEDASLRERLGARAAVTARQYTWERNAHQLREILLGILAKKNASLGETSNVDSFSRV